MVITMMNAVIKMAKPMIKSMDSWPESFRGNGLAGELWDTSISADSYFISDQNGIENKGSDMTIMHIYLINRNLTFYDL